MTIPPNDADRVEHVYEERTPTSDRSTVVVEDRAVEQHASVYRVDSLVWLLVGIVEVLLGLRFILRLLAANPASPFAALIYSLTDILLWPFYGLFGSPTLGGGTVVEFFVLVAIVVYAFLGWLVSRLLWLLFYRPAARSVRSVRRDRY